MKTKSGRGGSCLELMNTTNVSEILPQKCLHWKKIIYPSTLSCLQVDGVNAVGDFVGGLFSPFFGGPSSADVLEGEKVSTIQY